MCGADAGVGVAGADDGEAVSMESCGVSIRVKHQVRATALLNLENGIGQVKCNELKPGAATGE